MLRIRIATSLAAWMLMFGFGEEACADFHLVLPGGLGDVEGDFQLLNTPPPANGTRIQWVYSASDFKAVPQGRNSLVSISWRPDESVTGPNHASIDDLELRLSTTNAKPGTLSSSMDDNIGGDELVVYSGAIDFRTEGAGAETGPRAFDYVIDFQTPFVYDQDQGNLLLDFTFRPPIEGLPGVDAQSFFPPPAFSSDIGRGPAYLVTQFAFRQVGDFDGDGQLSAADIDLLSSAVGATDRPFDLDRSGIVDLADHSLWVKELRKTWLGDANLDGEFNSGDLVAIFVAGEYEDEILENSGWSEGDWNADGDFDSGDLVVAFTDGGYEQGPNPMVNAVPESTSFLMLITGLVGIAICRRLVAH